MTQHVNLFAFVKNKAETFLWKLSPEESVSSDPPVSTYNNLNTNNITNSLIHLTIMEKESMTFSKTVNSSNIEKEEEREDEEEEEEPQVNIIFRENHAAFYTRLTDLIKVWKKNQTYELVIHKQQLLYYNIIDISLDAPPIPKEDLNLISKTEYRTYIPSISKKNLYLLNPRTTGSNGETWRQESRLKFDIRSCVMKEATSANKV